MLAEHYRLAEAIYDPQFCCRRMRKFGIKYSRLHPQPEAVRTAFVAVDNPDQWRELLKTWYP